MNTRVDKLTTEIHTMLATLQQRAQEPAGHDGGGLEHLEKSLHAEIDALNKKLIGSEPSVHVAEALVAGWVATESADAKARARHAVAKGDEVALEARAKASEGYAQAMGVIAASAVHRAAKAALEAAASQVRLHSARRALSAH